MFDDFEKTPINKAHLLRFIEMGWNDLQAYLDTLSAEQISMPTDAAGWTGKDHVMHLACWEDRVSGLLEKQTMAEAMGVDQTIIDGGVEAINAALQQRYRDLPVEAVREALRRSHERLLSKISVMSDEELMRPHRDYEPGSTREDPVLGWIVGDTFEHYAEHKPWIAAIASR